MYDTVYPEILGNSSRIDHHNIKCAIILEFRHLSIIASPITDNSIFFQQLTLTHKKAMHHWPFVTGIGDFHFRPLRVNRMQIDTNRM